MYISIGILALYDDECTRAQYDDEGVHGQHDTRGSADLRMSLQIASLIRDSLGGVQAVWGFALACREALHIHSSLDWRLPLVRDLKQIGPYSIFACDCILYGPYSGVTY